MLCNNLSIKTFQNRKSVEIVQMILYIFTSLDMKNKCFGEKLLEICIINI